MSLTGVTRPRERAGLDDLFAMAEVMLWGDVGLDSTDAELRSWRGRRVTLYRYSGSGISVRRTDDYLEDEFAETLSIGFTLAGAVTATVDGETVTYQPGDVAAMRLDRPLETRAQPGSVLAFVNVPLRDLESRGIDTRQLNGQRWQAGVLCTSVLGMVEHILNDASDADAQVLERAILEIVVGILATRDSDASADDVTEQTRARAMQLIDEHYTDVDLDADRIAAMLGSSRRYLYGLFEGRGPSIATLIRDRRAAHAEQLLLNEPSFSIRRVAHLSGFGSEDRLLRTFKQVTGHSPSAYRRRAATGELGASIR